MKRLQSDDDKEKPLVSLNEDIFSVVIQFYKPDSILDILNFVLINKSVASQIYRILPYWIDGLCFLMKASHQTIMQNERYHREPVVLLEYLKKHSVSYRKLYLSWYVEKESKDGPRREYLETFLDLVKEAFIHKTLHNKFRIKRVVLTNTTPDRLANLCFFDSSSMKAIPLENLSHSSVYRFPETNEMVETMRKMISENTVRPITKLADRGLESALHRSNIKGLYYEFLKNFGYSLCNEKTFPTSLIGDICIRGEHISSDTAETNRVRDSIYYCDLLEGSLIKKEDAVFLYMTSAARFCKICDILKLDI